MNGSSNLNDVTVNDPNILSHIFNIHFNFKSYQIALGFVITKAYTSIKKGLVKRYIRRFWFREIPESNHWKVFGFYCVQFGDHPAAALMTISPERAAETYKEITEV